MARVGIFLCLLALASAARSAEFETAPASAVVHVTGRLTDDAPYLRALTPGVTILPLLTVGETMIRAPRSKKIFRFPGAPDGLGVWRDSGARLHVLVSHDLSQSTPTLPYPGESLRRGAFVSEIVFLSTPALRIESGGPAFFDVFMGTVPQKGRFGGFRSGVLAGSEAGFEPGMYLVAEQSPAPATFDGGGGLSAAVFDGESHLLPEMGRFQKESLAVAPETGDSTVIFALEDAAGTFASHLYLYVGTKQKLSLDPLARAGLREGRLYAFQSQAPGVTNEFYFHQPHGKIRGRWVELSSAAALSEGELERATQEKGAFGFVRLQDGAFDPDRRGVFYFTTAGKAKTPNRRGRLYRLRFDADRPEIEPAELEILLEGDLGDPFINPHRVAMNRRSRLLIQERPVRENQGEFLQGRESALWIYDLKKSTAVRIAEVNPLAAPFAMRGIRGSWNSSGGIDVSELFGEEAWLVGVQARTLDSRRASALQGLKKDVRVAEGGQLLLILGKPK